MTTILTQPNPSVSGEFLRSLCLFGIPAVLMYLSFWYVRPWMVHLGVPAFDAAIVTLIVPLSLLLVGSLVGFYLESRDNPQSLRTRFRFPRFRFIYLVRGVALFLLANILWGLFYIINNIVITSLHITLPANRTPFFSSSIDISSFESFVGAPLRGNYAVFGVYLLLLVINVVGEELWWRGYILPRQEHYFGTYTWIIHGLLWDLFHIFKWWELIPLLAPTLLIPYMAQRYQENWSALITHFLFNGLFGIVLFIAVFL